MSTKLYSLTLSFSTPRFNFKGKMPLFNALNLIAQEDFVTLKKQHQGKAENSDKSNKDKISGPPLSSRSQNKYTYKNSARSTKKLLFRKCL